MIGKLLEEPRRRGTNAPVGFPDEIPRHSGAPGLRVILRRILKKVSRKRFGLREDASICVTTLLCRLTVFVVNLGTAPITLQVATLTPFEQTLRRFIHSQPTLLSP